MDMTTALPATCRMCMRLQYACGNPQPHHDAICARHESVLVWLRRQQEAIRLEEKRMATQLRIGVFSIGSVVLLYIIGAWGF